MSIKGGVLKFTVPDFARRSHGRRVHSFHSYKFGMEAPLYNQEGSKIGTVSVPDNIFGIRWNANLVHDVIEMMRSSRRIPIAHVKGRGEVRGGGKKPWRQKGTGRARHGSIRSPLWPGGGVTHGPTKERNFSKKINKNVKKKALAAVLSRKLKEGEVIFLDALDFSAPKTKIAASTFRAFGESAGFEKFASRGGRTLVLLAEPKKDTIRAIRNLPYVEVEESRNINVEQALTPKFLVITKDALSKISA